MQMRLLIRELLDKKQMTPYGLVKASDGRVSLSTAYRLYRDHGRVKTFDAEILETLCEVLDVTPGELLEREGMPVTRRRREKPRPKTTTKAGTR